MAEVVTPIPTGALIPQEYQDQLDLARRRQQIAQMMYASSMANKGPQQIGPVAARISPLAALANIAQAGIGGFMDAQSMQDASKVKSQFEADQNADLQRIYGLPETQQSQAAQLSKFPQNQAIGRALQTQLEKRREMESGVYKDAGQTDQALAVLRGQPIPANTGPRTPTEGAMSDPMDPARKIPYMLTYDAKGTPHISFAPQGTTVNNVLPTKEGEMALDVIKSQLKERGDRANVAKQTFASANQAIDALEAGARAGGGENAKQALRKGLQFFGISLPETASTEQLQQALLEGVVSQAKNLRPASDTDIRILQQMVGNAGTDPTALTKALAFAQAMAMKDLDAYNQYAGENSQNIDPRVRSLFTGATSGYELPQSLPGPQAYQMELVRQLQRQGFDISRLRDPSGKPFAPDAKFDINPIAGFPGVRNLAPTPLKPGAKGTAENPLKIQDLSPEQKEMLRRTLGGQ